MSSGSQDKSWSSENVLDFSCKTKITTERCRFKWVIENFSFCQQTFGEKLKSSPFQTSSSSSIKWHLNLYPNGDTPRSEGFLSIFLAPSSPGVTAKFKFSLLRGAEGQKECSQGSIKTFQDTNGFGYSQFVRRQEVDRCGLLRDDTLTVLCELETAELPSVEWDRTNVVTTKLRQDLKQLYTTSKFSDVTLSTSDRDFKVHKGVLSARSPVFAAMFDHHMTESRSNQVQIVDAESAILEQLLLFIYTGECPEIERRAADLFPLADKYDMDDLKSLCENSLSQQLTADNAVATLILADLHSANRLKDKVISFIISQGKSAVESPAWKSLLLSHPHLATQVCAAVFERDLILRTKM